MGLPLEMLDQDQRCCDAIHCCACYKNSLDKLLSLYAGIHDAHCGVDRNVVGIGDECPIPDEVFEFWAKANHLI